ncbi:MAG TPA: YxlC family protein [Hydrogenispora sp.]|jgi:hypothetical protein|nr:YxlC family protein [Hydrogenispora sp.]
MEKERELINAMNELKEPLDTFSQETERMAAAIPTPPLDHFQKLISQTRHRTRRQLVIESLLFLLVAFCFLGGVGFLLQKGYLLPVIAGYASIGWILPFVILWAPIAEKREVN